jgi:hypothetical protein
VWLLPSRMLRSHRPGTYTNRRVTGVPTCSDSENPYLPTSTLKRPTFGFIERLGEHLPLPAGSGGLVRHPSLLRCRSRRSGMPDPRHGSQRHSFALERRSWDTSAHCLAPNDRLAGATAAGAGSRSRRRPRCRGGYRSHVEVDERDIRSERCWCSGANRRRCEIRGDCVRLPHAGHRWVTVLRRGNEDRRAPGAAHRVRNRHGRRPTI